MSDSGRVLIFLVEILGGDAFWKSCDSCEKENWIVIQQITKKLTEKYRVICEIF